MQSYKEIGSPATKPTTKVDTTGCAYLLRRECWVVRHRSFLLIGASVSEPHIDEFNVNFLYFYISIYISI